MNGEAWETNGLITHKKTKGNPTERGGGGGVQENENLDSRGT